MNLHVTRFDNINVWKFFHKENCMTNFLCVKLFQILPYSIDAGFIRDSCLPHVGGSLKNIPSCAAFVRLPTCNREVPGKV